MKTYLILAASLALFGGGVAVGVKIASPATPQTLPPAALHLLRTRMAELRATPAQVVTRFKEVIREVPDNLAADAEELISAAGEEPEEASSFVLTPEPVARVDVAGPSSDETCDPCRPEEFTVSGVELRFGAETAMLARLKHAHGDETIWDVRLTGDLRRLPPPEPPRISKWLAGVTVAVDGDRELAYGGVVGRTWTHAAVLVGVDRERTWGGVAVRW